MARSAKQSIQLGDVPPRYLQDNDPEVVEQPHVLETACAGSTPVRCALNAP